MLPSLDPDSFEEQLRQAMAGLGVAPADLATDVMARLFAHYRELRRWAPRLNLLGPAAEKEILARHYAESLAGLSLLEGHLGPLPRSSPERRPNLVDVGSGAGFPGLLLASALPACRCLLFESRGRKAEFLRAAARRMELRVEVVNERVHAPLPDSVPRRIDCLTLRAVRLEDPEWSALAARLGANGRVFHWTTVSTGAKSSTAGPERWLEMDQRQRLGGERRELVVWKRSKLRMQDRANSPVREI